MKMIIMVITNIDQNSNVYNIKNENNDIANKDIHNSEDNAVILLMTVAINMMI